MNEEAPEEVLTDPESFCLSRYFEPIVEKLLETTDRSDATQNNLRSAAYEALMEMLKNSPKDCYPTVQKTTLLVLQRLSTLLNSEVTLLSSLSSFSSSLILSSLFILVLVVVSLLSSLVLPYLITALIANLHPPHPQIFTRFNLNNYIHFVKTTLTLLIKLNTCINKNNFNILYTCIYGRCLKMNSLSIYEKYCT